MNAARQSCEHFSSMWLTHGLGFVKIASCRHCTGCGACAHVCAFGAITMKPDELGFLYPTIDEAKCRKCGKCAHICPINDMVSDAFPLDSYVVRSQYLAVLKRTTSGGVCHELAKRVISSGGIAFGAAFVGGDFSVSHIGVSSVDELVRIDGSKYVQSDVSGVYAQVAECLSKGRKVLFTGTPCQTAGMRKVFGKHENLVLIAIACWCVPPPGVYAQWKLDLVRENGVEISEINFRSKERGYLRSECVVSFRDGRQKRFPHSKDPMRLCMDVCKRLSCGNCVARRNRSGADLIVGDCWSIKSLCPEWSDGEQNGASIVLIGSQLGVKELEACADLEKVKIQDIKRAVGILGSDTPFHRKREQFIAEYKHRGVEATLKRVRPSFAYRLGRRAWRILSGGFHG